MITEFPDDLVAASSAEDVWTNYVGSKRLISSLMGVEGLHAIGNSPSMLRLYHSMGVRYATLTHFCHNKYADSASMVPYWHGLSEDGKAIVREMNRIGMMVDLAHTSADTSKLEMLSVLPAGYMLSMLLVRQTLDYTSVPVRISQDSTILSPSFQRALRELSIDR